MLAKILMAITMALTALGSPAATSDVFAAGDHYVHVDTQGALTLWEESNGREGLQAAPVYVLGFLALDADTQLLH